MNKKKEIILLPQFNSRQSIKFNILDWCMEEMVVNGVCVYMWFSLALTYIPIHVLFLHLHTIME